MMQSNRYKNRVFSSFIVSLYTSVSIVAIFNGCIQENYGAHSTPNDSGVSSSYTSNPDFCSDSSGQEAELETVDQDLQLSLAKICVSESGFQVRTNDCTLIYHVLRGRSVTGELTMGIMRAYARNVFNENRKDSRRWITNLNSRFEEPIGWAENVTIPWSLRREGFIDVYRHVGELLRTRPTETPCGVKVSHWGARGFRRELHLSRGWRLVECGKTNNDFWVVPSRQNSEEIEQEITEEIEQEITEEIEQEITEEIEQEITEEIELQEDPSESLSIVDLVEE